MPKNEEVGLQVICKEEYFGRFTKAFSAGNFIIDRGP
jgi:hypothetical protein